MPPARAALVGRDASAHRAGIDAPVPCCRWIPVAAAQGHEVGVLRAPLLVRGIRARGYLRAAVAMCWKNRGAVKPMMCVGSALGWRTVVSSEGQGSGCWAE